jgi:hypothetical protein
MRAFALYYRLHGTHFRAVANVQYFRVSIQMGLIMMINAETANPTWLDAAFEVRHFPRSRAHYDESLTVV